MEEEEEVEDRTKAEAEENMADRKHKEDFNDPLHVAVYSDDGEDAEDEEERCKGEVIVPGETITMADSVKTASQDQVIILQPKQPLHVL